MMIVAATSTEDYRTAKAIKGTCTTLEKAYYRLTAEPDPRTVRPLPILKQSLDIVKERWRRDEDYTFTCSQLKSIRQDLRVQHIRNAFTVKVYETHARVALEVGDLNEYQICSARLAALEEEDGLKGSYEGEFAAYKLLHALYHHSNQEVLHLMGTYKAVRCTEPMVHATQVVTAYYTSNYSRFFSLYKQAPHMSGYLMDFLVQRMRVAAFARMCKTYSPVLATDYIQHTLSFFTKKEAVEFIRAQGGIFTDPQRSEQVDTKASRAAAATGVG